MKKQRLMLFFLCLILLCGAFSAACNAESSAEGEGAAPVISIASVTAGAGDTVEVPIHFANGGKRVCGLTIRLSFDDALTLTGIRSGSAFSSLTMTRPGDYSTSTPVVLWDGLEEDEGEGELAFLTFQLPETAAGRYSITASCEAGDVIDGSLKDIEVAFMSGSIAIGGGTDAEPDMILPASLAIIGDEAFMGGGFAYVKLSDRVTSIGRRAFANCPNLRHVYIPAGATVIAADAFAGAQGLVIHGVSGSYAETYAAANGFVFLAE